MEAIKAVEIQGYTKRLKNRAVLDDVTVTINQGDICGIVGANGSGKSMLLKAISGFLQPTSGQATVFGKQVGKNGKLAADMGLLIETPGLMLNYNAYKNLKCLSAISKKGDDKSIRETLSALGLDTNDTRPARKFSLGMKQKLGIAQAVFENPRLVLLDEPTSNVDESSMTSIRELIRKMNDEYGTTFLIASHQMDDLAGLCTRMFKMDNGRLEERAQ